MRTIFALSRSQLLLLVVTRSRDMLIYVVYHYSRASAEGAPYERNDILHVNYSYTRYPIVARALGIAFRPSARASKGFLHTSKLQITLLSSAGAEG